MKVCPLCGENYQPFVDFCFVDGEVLNVENAVLDAPEPEGFDAPPPPKMLQGSQQSTGYTRSATPIPRARRPGRSLINRPDGGGVYSPPADDAPPAPVGAANLTEADEDEVLEAPPMVEEVEEIEAYGYDEEDVPEPQPEPILQHREPEPEPAITGRRAATPIPSSDVDYEEEEEEESGAFGLVFIGLGAIVLIGVVGAIGALAAGTILAGSNDTDTETVRLPEPPPDPVPAAPGPSSPDPSQPDPIQVGKVDPGSNVEPGDPQPGQPEPVEPATPDPTQPDPTQPDPVLPDPVLPDPVAPDPVVVPDPDDGVAVIRPDPTAQSGRVLFTSKPDGAYIVLDGVKIGTTRFETTVGYGAHDLVLEKEGYESVETRFELSVPELTLSTYSLTSLTPEPEPLPPTPRPAGKERKVMFFHSETGVNVLVNGTADGCAAASPSACVTPATYQLPPGRYTIGFTPGGVPKTCTVEIEPGDNAAFIQLHQVCP